MIEGGTAIAIFIRCFTDAHGLNRELPKMLHFHFPREVLSAICVSLFLFHLQFFISLFFLFFYHLLIVDLMRQVLLVLVTAYGAAALGQLFFFHVVLIRKVFVITRQYYI